MTFRRLTVAPAAMPDAIGFTQWVAHRLNNEHGFNASTSINIGGDPSAIVLGSPWESLGAYEAARASFMADDQLQAAIKMASGLYVGAEDSIARILRPPGDRGNYASVSTAMMHLPAMLDAVAFAVELAEYVSGKHGFDVGVFSAVTGNRAGLGWVSYSDSLAQVGERGDAVEADEGYLAFFAKSADLFVPTTLESQIWQLL